MAIITGTQNAETLPGTPGDDSISGLGGNDILQGGLGNDTYRYTVGDGSDTINDSGGVADQFLIVGSVSAVIDMFRAGIGFADLHIFMSDGAEVVIQNHFTTGQIETIADTTGKSFNLLQGIIGGAGNDVLIGTANAETLD